MIFKPLACQDKHDILFFKHKHPYEDLGLAYIDKTDINFQQDTLLMDVKNFFCKGVFTENLDGIVKENIHAQIPNDKINNYRKNIEAYVKLAWLTHEYLNSGCNFVNPVGAIFDPIQKKWEIHPGGSRQLVYKMFGKRNKIFSLAFNTGGKKIDFIKKFHNRDELRQYFSDRHIYFVVCAEWGTLIPHVHFDQPLLTNNIIIQTKKILNFWKNTNVTGDVPEWVHCLNSKDKPNKLHIEVKDSSNNIELIKGLILVPFNSSFYDYGIKITNVST